MISVFISLPISAVLSLIDSGGSRILEGRPTIIGNDHFFEVRFSFVSSGQNREKIKGRGSPITLSLPNPSLSIEN